MAFSTNLLQLGNLLNAGSFRAGAEGFKTECLTRLSELRTNDGKSSLLQYALSAGLLARGDDSWSELADVGAKVRAAAVSDARSAVTRALRVEFPSPRCLRPLT